MRAVSLILLALTSSAALGFHDCGALMAGAALRVAVLDGEGVTSRSAAYARSVLGMTAGTSVESVLLDTVAAGALKPFDVVVLAGGSATKQYQSLGESGVVALKQFVRDGGGYVGLCAGAYLAGVAPADYALGLLPIQVLDREHWKRGAGYVALNPEPNFEKLPWPEIWRYVNGPLMGLVPATGLAEPTVVARFKSDIHEGGAPAGIMPGAIAIVRGAYGRGRVAAFSPHPELTLGAEGFLFQATLWASSVAKKP